MSTETNSLSMMETEVPATRAGEGEGDEPADVAMTSTASMSTVQLQDEILAQDGKCLGTDSKLKVVVSSHQASPFTFSPKTFSKLEYLTGSLCRL